MNRKQFSALLRMLLLIQENMICFSFGNNLYLREVVLRFVYTLPSPDPNLWDFSGYVVDSLSGFRQVVNEIR